MNTSTSVISMDKLKVVTLAFLLLIVSVNGVEEEKEEGSSTIIDAAKRLFSLPTSSDYSWTFKLKSLFQQQWRPFSPPNLDFRGGSGGVGDEEAAGTVKEAVMKSLDKSKATVEDSAKSAAKFTVDNTLNKLKKSLPQHKSGLQDREEAEL